MVSALKGSAGKTLEFVRPQQGLHLLARLPKGPPSEAATDIRAQAGVEGWLLSETRLKSTDRDGYILGFSGYDLAELISATIASGQATKRYLAGFL